jgi:spore photoproduct lyase
VTFTKRIVKAIRKRGWSTKMLQMEMEPASKGKLSYPVRIKMEMFRAMYESLAPWHQDVFMYLCMEKRELWQATFGRAYDSNEAFEADFSRQVSRKLPDFHPSHNVRVDSNHPVPR